MDEVIKALKGNDICHSGEEISMLGIGNTAEVIEYEHGKVCKLFFEGYPPKYVEHEYQNAKEIFKLGLRIPEPFGLVTIDQRQGIIYERVDGEPLFNQRKNTNIDELLDMFTHIHRGWLEHHSNNVLSYKEYLSIMIQNRRANCRDLIEEIYTLPDDNCLLHGDFHPDNVLVRLSDGMPIAIDFMNVCHGPALYDIARTFFLLCQMDKSLANKYLKKMQVSKIDIVQYVKVIEQCRQYEI